VFFVRIRSRVELTQVRKGEVFFGAVIKTFKDLNLASGGSKPAVRRPSLWKKMKLDRKNVSLTFIYIILLLLAQPINAQSQSSSVDSKDETGLTELMAAAFDGDHKSIKTLLLKKANLEVKDNFGWTALMYAIASQDVASVEALLEGSADVNAADYRGNTPLMLAALGRKVKIVQLLLSKGANVNAKNKKGATALSYAEGKGNSKIAKVLQMAGGTGIELDKSDIPEKIAPVDQVPKSLPSPRNVKGSAPRYTEEAIKNNVSGKVRLRVLVGIDGNVKRVKVISGLPYGLTERAILVTSTLRFTPAKLDGRPVECWATIEFTFELQRLYYE